MPSSSPLLRLTDSRDDVRSLSSDLAAKIALSLASSAIVNDDVMGQSRVLRPQHFWFRGGIIKNFGDSTLKKSTQVILRVIAVSLNPNQTEMLVV